MPNGNPTPGPLNSRYFRPIRRKETRARRWDLQFESTSLQRGVDCKPDFFDAPDRGAGTTAEIEEERRLLYVAMTRARDDLHLVVRSGSSPMARMSRTTVMSMPRAAASFLTDCSDFLKG
jgi:ATP-dependent exoDNAse (exonuclease V) beta subunit